MYLLKTIQLQWWQAGVFKAGMWAIGIAVGVHWHYFFAGYLQALIILAVVCLGYTAYVWAEQETLPA
jgi:hypothetical protein